MSDHRQLAEKIVERLFRNGQGQEASRLQLMVEIGYGHEGGVGGWSREAATALIEEVLTDDGGGWS